MRWVVSYLTQSKVIEISPDKDWKAIYEDFLLKYKQQQTPTVYQISDKFLVIYVSGEIWLGFCLEKFKSFVLSPPTSVGSWWYEATCVKF